MPKFPGSSPKWVGGTVFQMSRESWKMNNYEIMEWLAWVSNCEILNSLKTSSSWNIKISQLTDHWSEKASASPGC